ncbi:hypothetical protein VOLCADRAFT_92385 [Volvox carteri f. nagariensis]|uniref:Nucleotide-diphospho-sugar transferase domain-containing protein n=1 Tax=Volvox carteri f. nagariensis TaxID=3068 RepID=D8TZI8_VOLCA|nr:uncharacterized protein VOLCADRAFT_92385 [Volvox carteri f. nagariensis]EFJ47189.1 hypothetical protein VOLCADRAFT_92385 [Volvox carteri f. nagariensis]|eukprot:XP_002951738.1 hypothetical protein VOLCADRAFT_92385 [Volvox carteri f. nagariensis]
MVTPVGDNDDDGAQNDAPGNLDEDDDTAEEGAAAAGANTTVGGGNQSAAAAAAAIDVGAGADGSSVSALEGSSRPGAVDGSTDYDNDNDQSDLYVDVDPDVEDYDANQDVDPKKLVQRGQSQKQKQGEQEQTPQKQKAEKQDVEKAGQQEQQQQQQQPPAEGAAAEAVVEVEGAPDGCGSLSRELLAQWAVNNTVMVAFTNSIMFRNFGPTWLHHVRKAGIKYWVLAVADNDTAKLVRNYGADHCFLVHENEIDDTAADFKWGSRSWQLHTWQKVLTVRHVHMLGFHVINSDMDVVWLRNPLEHFLVKYTEPDYWVSMDPITTANPLGDDGPELGVSTHHYMNTGVYFLRQTPGGRALIDKWYEIRSEMQKTGFHDQDGLYNYFKDSGQLVRQDIRVTLVVEGKTKLAQLPATLFQNGYSHCINQIHKVHGLQPFEVHFVWVWGGNAGKISRMREQMYYIDPPSYYSDGYFLSYDVEPIQVRLQISRGSTSAAALADLPLLLLLLHLLSCKMVLVLVLDPAGFNEWRDTEAMVETHLTALDSQLTDTWYGLALAALLNRTVVLPKMKCFCIQNWFENPQCRLPGEPHTRFPLAPACPADYVFNMDALASFNVSGRRVEFREFSFLDNERTHAEVKERPLVVIASRKATAPSRDGDVLTIPSGLKSGPLLAALQPFLQAPAADVAGKTAAKKVTGAAPKRLHFRNPRLAFGGWSDPAVAQEFEAHVAGLPVRWCCRPDAVAKEHKVEVHHQLTMHPAKEVTKEGGGGSASAATAQARLRLRLQH